MKRILAISMLLYMASAAAAPPTMKFFFQEGCPDCGEVEFILDRLQEHYGGALIIERISILSDSGLEEFKRLGFEATPAIVIGNKKIEGKENITYEKLCFLVDGLLYAFPWRLSPLLIFLLGFFSSISPGATGVTGTILSTLSRRRRSLQEALFKSFLFSFFFTFILLFTLTLLNLVLNLLFNQIYYVSVLMAFFVSACALVLLNSSLCLVSRYDFARYRIRKIKTMIPRGYTQTISLCLYVFVSGLVVMVPAFPVIVSDNFFLGDAVAGFKNSSFFSFGFLLGILFMSWLSCFSDALEWISRRRIYAHLYNIASGALLFIYGYLILRFVLTLSVSPSGMIFTFAMTVLFFAALGWVAGRWRK